MAFNEKNINRDDAGRFDEKPQSAPEVALAVAPDMTAYEAARDSFLAAKRTFQEEAMNAARRLAGTIPGAKLVVFEGYEAVDGDGPWVGMDSVQDADGEPIQLDPRMHADLYDLGMDLDPHTARDYMDGYDGPMLWLDLAEDAAPAQPAGPADPEAHMSVDAQYDAMNEATDALRAEFEENAIAFEVEEETGDVVLYDFDSMTADEIARARRSDATSLREWQAALTDLHQTAIHNQHAAD